MIWSFVKILVFLALAIAIALGTNYVLDTGGEVRIAFGGREWSFQPIVAILLVIAAFLAAYILLKLAGLLVAFLRFINGDETAMSRYFDRNREKKGYSALADGIVALAEGDGRRAVANATKAERLLQRPELTRLISAQAAEMNGNKEKALSFYKQLVTNDTTRFVGVQGILRQKLDEGDTDTALELAKKAFALRPQHEGTMETLFHLQSDKKDWAGARRTLEARVKNKVLPKDVGQRRAGVLALADARAALQEDRKEDALAAAELATKKVPGLVPAAAMSAVLLAEAGNKRKANKVVRKAWSASPHPDLAAAFAAIEPDETPNDRIKRFGDLLSVHKDNVEATLIEAELLLAAEDFPAARKVMGDLAEKDPTTRALTIMAAIERGSGASEEVVSGWLAKALSAPRGDTWTCQSCKHIAGNWDPVCENCAGFDTLEWKRAPMSEDTQVAAAAMLPLVVGKGLNSEAANSNAADETVNIVGEQASPETDVQEEQLQRTGS